MKRRTVRVVRVFANPRDRRLGRLVAGNLTMPCALGRTGARRDKREGDGATPIGRYGLGLAFFRADRLLRPRTLLRFRALRHDDGWSEDPADRRYNRPIRTVRAPGEDAMWRSDHLYDVVVEIAYNARPRIKGRGSAIFLHLARDGFAPTAGCVAVEAVAMRKLLAVIGPRTRIVIG